MCRAIYDQQAIEDLCCLNSFYPWLRENFKRRGIDINKLQEIFVVTNTDDTVYVKVSTEQTPEKILALYYLRYPEERPGAQ